MHALITGASSGIGASTAVAFARAGFDLTLAARRKEKLEEVASEAEKAGVKAKVLTVDLSEPSAAEQLIAAVEGPIDVLINNAGVERVGFAPKQPDDVVESQIRLNLLTPLRTSRLVLPGMIERKAGSIVDVCSVASWVHPPYQTYYSATKAALAAYSYSLREELRRYNVHVMTVFPGPMKTAMGVSAAEATTAPAFLVPWGHPDVLGRRILRGVQRRHSTLVYPRFFHLARWFPVIGNWATYLMPHELK